jgi:hypothetical protein
LGKRAEQAVAKLTAERDQTLRDLLDWKDEDCHKKVAWYGRETTVGHMFRNFAGHELDHFQHLHRLMEARGQHLSEANLLFMKAQAVLAEFQVMALSLSDEEFERPGPNEGDWSAAQVVEHVIEQERMYRAAVLSAHD